MTSQVLTLEEARGLLHVHPTTLFEEVLLALGGWKTANMVERYAHIAPGFAAEYAGNVKISR